MDKFVEIFIKRAEKSNSYIPAMNTKMFYCSEEVYEKVRNEQPEKLQHFPVLHRYYQNGFCVNTDGIGNEFSGRGVAYMSPSNSEYPDELIRDVEFPLMIELSGDEITSEESGFWDNWKGDFDFEKFIIAFSLTGKTTKIYRIFVRISEKEGKCNTERLKVQELLLPPYPVYFEDRMWYGEEAKGDYQFSDLISELVRAIKNEEAYFSEMEKDKGILPELFEERKRNIIKYLETLEMNENE